MPSSTAASVPPTRSVFGVDGDAGSTVSCALLFERGSVEGPYKLGSKRTVTHELRARTSVQAGTKMRPNTPRITSAGKMIEVRSN